MADEPQNQGGQPDSRPDWLLDKFSSVDEQARAYAEAERFTTQSAQEKAEALRRAEEAEAYAEAMAEQLEAVQGQPQQFQQPQYGFDPIQVYAAQLEQAREAGDTRAEVMIQAALNSMLLDSRLKDQAQQPPPDPHMVEQQHENYALWADQIAREQYESKYPGSWDDLKPELAAYFSANPDRLPHTLTAKQAAERLIETAELIEGRKLLAGQADNQQSRRQQRLLAQSLTQSGNPPTRQDDDGEYWERIKNAPVDSYAALRSQRP